MKNTLKCAALLLKASIFGVAILLLASCSKNDDENNGPAADSLGKTLVANFVDPWHKVVDEAGFTQKTVQIRSANISYEEGPNNGPALVMLHAQMMDWFDYSRVLPVLSKSYHIFVVDYHGHGKTTAPTELMNANDIGNDLATFMETLIGEPAYVTGNSSGGLLAAWLAANKPTLVKAVVLEDPPLFSSEYPRIKSTVGYKSFATSHTYVETGASDFLIYWLENSPGMVENYIGTDKLPYLISAINTYRTANPGQPVELPIPVLMRMLVRGISLYDPHFGDAFYTGVWNSGFDHAETLKKITCPALLLHANFTYTADGLLDGAMDQNDADLAMSLLPNGKYQRIDAAHVVHLDKPEEFINIINQFFLNK